MWHTSCGDRILKGAEAQLFRATLGSLVDEITMDESTGDDEEEDLHLDVAVFDRLTRGQKLAMLELVGRALLIKSVPMPELTAVAEGTVAAIYEYLRQETQVELDVDECEHWRRAIRAARLEQKKETGDPDYTVPRMKCFDSDEWGHCILAMRDRVLWDEDYKDAELAADLPPKESRDFKRLSGIERDYTIALAPDPSPKELNRLKSRLRRLERKKGKGKRERKKGHH